MWTLISFIVVAIIVFVVLAIFNMNAVSSEKKSEKVSAKVDNQNNNEKVENLLIPADILEHEKVESINVEEVIASNINDEGYRRALKSFQVTEKEDNVKQPREKMKDDDFRKALQSISGKADNVD
jgi:short subunit fatty acids transporter